MLCIYVFIFITSCVIYMNPYIYLVFNKQMLMCVSLKYDMYDDCIKFYLYIQLQRTLALPHLLD